MRPFYRTRPVVCTAVMFGTGIYLGLILPHLPIMIGSMCLLSLAVLIFSYIVKKEVLLPVLGLFFFLGMLYTGVLSHPQLPKEGQYHVRGYISGTPILKSDERRIKIYLRNVTLEDEQGNVFEQNKMYHSFIEDDEEMMAKVLSLRDGDGVSFRGRVYHPSPKMNPYGFDFEKYLKGKGIFLGISGFKEPDFLPPENQSFTHIAFEARDFLSRKMDDIFGEKSYYPKTLLLGVRDEMPDEVRENFAKLGIAHLLAVSGLHVGLIVFFLDWLLQKFHLSPKEHFCLSGAFVLCYCALLNFAVPVVRASVLIMVMQLRKIVRRADDPLTTLSAALFIVLLFFPMTVLSLSFQLSFGAACGMILFEAPFEKLLNKLPWQNLKRMLAVHFSASLGVLIPTVSAFHRISLLGVLINPIASAAMNILLPGYILITFIGSVFLPAGQLLAKGFHLLCGFIPELMEKTADLPFANIHVRHIPWMISAALICVFLMCTRYVTLSAGKRIVICLSAAAVAMGIVVLTKERNLCYIQFHAGQADCGVIMDEDTTVVIDTGQTGQDLADFLLSAGRKIDTLIITHLHMDHCGGIPKLLEKEIPIGQVMFPKGAEDQRVEQMALQNAALLKKAGIPVIYTGAGDRIDLPNGKITFLWPYAARKNQNANDFCLSAYCELDGVSLLSTGDTVGLYEKYMLHDADLLKVCHHGSGKSSTPEFLKAASPSYALVPCGKNRILPSPETLERLEDSGAKVIRMDEKGAAIFRIKDGKYRLNTYFQQSEEDRICSTMNFLRP